MVKKKNKGGSKGGRLVRTLKHCIYFLSCPFLSLFSLLLSLKGLNKQWMPTDRPTNCTKQALK